MSKKTVTKPEIAPKSEKVLQLTKKSGSKSSSSNNSGSKKKVTKPEIAPKSEKVLQLTKKTGSKSSASNTSGSNQTVTKKVPPKVAPKPQKHAFVLTENELHESKSFSRGMSGNSGKSVKPGKLGNRVSIFEKSLHSSSHSMPSSKSNTHKNSGKMSSTQDNTIEFLTPLPRSTNTHTPLKKTPPPTKERIGPSARKNSSKSSNQMSSVMKNSKPFRPPQPLPKPNQKQKPNQKNDIYAVPNKKKSKVPKPPPRKEKNKESGYAEFGNEEDPIYAEANEDLENYETYIPTASNNDSNIYEEVNDLPSNNTQQKKSTQSQKLDPKRVKVIEKVLSKPKPKTKKSLFARIKNIFRSCTGAKCKTKKRKGSNSSSRSSRDSSEA